MLYKGYRFKLKRRKSQFPSFGMCSSWSIEANGCARILRPPPVIIARSNRAYVRMMYVLLVDFMYILSVCVKVRKIRWYVLYLEEKMKKLIVPPKSSCPNDCGGSKSRTSRPGNTVSICMHIIGEYHFLQLLSSHVVWRKDSLSQTMVVH